MRATTGVPVLLTPQGPLHGWQDTTNGAFVAGWAWDRDQPDTPIRVAIYDGAVLLATVTAGSYRKDLQDAGIGDGRHAFVYALAPHIRDRKAHQITVRIADTDVALRDWATGDLPRPVTARDQPPPIPHFSLSPAWRWGYFTALRRALAVFPCPVWRPLAVLLGGIQMLADRQSRALNVALLRALGMPTALRTRWRLHWSRAYQRQADVILLAQGERMTPRWAARQTRFNGALPPGGAILVSVHHNGARLAHLTLAAHGYTLGTIIGLARDPDALAQADATLRIHSHLTDRSGQQSFGDRRFIRPEAGRKGLRLLTEGGYLIIAADEFARQEPFSPLLGKAMTVPRGAVWFAERSGKPIIPYMVVPEGLHWRLWVGEAVEPTQAGLCRALEGCIRRAPGSWQRFMAMPWLAAPPWSEPGEPRALP